MPWSPEREDEIDLAARPQNVERWAMRTRAWILAILVLAGCVYHDPRSPEQIAKDEAIWTKADEVKVTLASDQLRECKSLGIVNQVYGEGVPSRSKPLSGGTFEESVLRYKTVLLGGNAAVLINAREWSSTVKDWERRVDRTPLSAGPSPHERRPVGEAYRCDTPRP